MNEIIPQTLLAVVKAELLLLPPQPALFASFTPQLWNDFYKLCCRQGVGSLVFHYLVRLKEQPAQPDATASAPQPDDATERPPLALYMQWALHAENNKANREVQLNAALKLHHILATHGIDMMILKGIGLSSLYPDPSLREFGDLDIYLYGKQAQADRILASEYGIPVSTDVHHHTVFTLDGVPVENHYDFIDTSAHPSSRALEKTLKQLAHSQAPEEIVVTDPVRLQIPSATLAALFYFFHTASHFAATSIPLRDVCDWYVLLKAYHKKIDFALLYQTCTRRHALPFLHCLNQLIVKLFDADPQWFGAEETKAAAGTGATAPSAPHLADRCLQDIFFPAYPDIPEQGISSIWPRYKRFRANAWKHRIVYPEPVWWTFLQSSFAHLIKPKTI